MSKKAVGVYSIVLYLFHLLIVMFQSKFACFFDIDGVITQGANLIPVAQKAIEKLNQYDVPYIFVSNSCMLESDKAAQLSNILGVSVNCHDLLQYLSMKIMIP